MPEEESAGSDTAADPGTDSPAEEKTSEGRSRLTHTVSAVLVAALAFAITVQVRQDDEQDYSTLRSVELVELLKSVDAANARLERQIDDLTKTRDQLTSSTARTDEARAQARKNAADLSILAGTVAAVGPGIGITIRDPERVVDSGQMLSLVEELRNAGAEAIEVDDRARIVATTAIVDTDDGLRIGGIDVAPPYDIDVIGSASTLAGALRIRRGIVDLLSANGADIDIDERDTVDVTALVDEVDPQYAQRDD